MSACSVRGCTVSYAKRPEGVMLFTIPKDERRPAWVEALKGKGSNWVPPSSVRICSQHFAPEAFWKNHPGKRQKVLLPGAIPTLQLRPASTEVRDGGTGESPTLLPPPLNECAEKMSEKEKYDHFLSLCAQAADLVSKCDVMLFLDKCKIIKDIISSLEKNVEVVVISNPLGDKRVPDGTHQQRNHLCLDGPQVLGKDNEPQVCNKKFKQSRSLLRAQAGEKQGDNTLKRESLVMCRKNSRITNCSGDKGDLGDKGVSSDVHEIPLHVDAPVILADTKQDDDDFHYERKSVNLSQSDNLSLPTPHIQDKTDQNDNKDNFHDVASLKNSFNQSPSDGVPDDLRSAKNKPEQKKKKTVRGDRSVLCHVCSKMMKAQRLRAHLRIHSGEKPYECKVCNRKFSHRSNLRNHMSTIHSEEKPHECSICGKKFKVMKNLKGHLEFHRGEKRYECRICSKKFRLPSGLKKHARVHTGEKPFECTICNTRFTQKHALDTHVANSHTGVKPFECTQCGKKYRFRSQLNSHIKAHKEKEKDVKNGTKIGKSHTGEKPFECAVCNKRFGQSCELEAHAQVHTIDISEAL
ncbi:zinc finger protein 70-like isoform X2 [Thrips palmi]|uniref:Zinc finger protein 70-like isoform X2 n=1 Tax=Thrips palmi TaxID=161013 RepID=A0A6P8Y8S7_THRPL|nr:zinc finger protein 70-like isoform X2 [Thrips palmi]